MALQLLLLQVLWVVTVTPTTPMAWHLQYICSFSLPVLFTAVCSQQKPPLEDLLVELQGPLTFRKKLGLAAMSASNTTTTSPLSMLP
jgi:hypothetical protein